MKKTTKQNILETLIELNRPLAEHEIWQYFQPRGIYANGHCISTRLGELERGTRRFPMVFNGKLYFIKTRKREGTNYNEWYIERTLATESKSDSDKEALLAPAGFSSKPKSEETPGIKSRSKRRNKELGGFGLSPGVSQMELKI